MGWIAAVVAAVSFPPGTIIACIVFLLLVDAVWWQRLLLGLPFCLAWYWGGYFVSGMLGEAAQLVLHGRERVS